jgi:hypothetical protein
MQSSVSFPAALGSNLWIANFLDKHRDDECVHASSSECKSSDYKTSHKMGSHVNTVLAQPSKNEAKFQKLYRKATAELRSKFNTLQSPYQKRTHQTEFIY